MTNYGIVKKIEQIEAQGYWHNDLFNSIWIDIVQWVLFLKIILTPLVKKIRNVFLYYNLCLGLEPVSFSFIRRLESVQNYTSKHYAVFLNFGYFLVSRWTLVLELDNPNSRRKFFYDKNIYTL